MVNKKRYEKLENFNTKLQSFHLELIRDLAITTNKSQRELLEEMLEIYEEQKPDLFKKIRRLRKKKFIHV